MVVVIMVNNDSVFYSPKIDASIGDNICQYICNISFGGNVNTNSCVRGSKV